MARTIQSIPEMYTGDIASVGVTRDVSLRIRVVFEGGDPDGEWYVFGTDPQPGLPAPVRAFDAVHYPAAFDLMGDRDGILYDNALESGRGMLET